MKDYYAILGVASSASESEVKKAYRRLAIQYHPDKNPAASAKPVFQEINEAYDVLGDSTKRASYDAAMANPFAAIFTEPVPQHRDPAYKRHRPSRPRKKEPSASFLIMRDSLKYVIWISRIGLLVTTLFFVDYFLPYRDVPDSVQGFYTMKSQRGNTHYIILTGSGKEIKIYDVRGADFRNDRNIHLAVTLIYGSVMSVSNSAGTFDAWVAYMYSTLLFFPVILFVNSLMALFYRNRVEMCFNLNVTAFIFLIINLILL